MIEFLGRLHPLIVHLPIGILLLAAGLHLLSSVQQTRNYESAAHVALLLGAVFAVAACVTGYLLVDESYDQELASRHKNFGLIMALIVLAMLWLNNSRKPSIKKKLRRKINSVLYTILVPLIFITGHFGGSLTHGSDFLFPAASELESALSSDSIDLNSTVYLQLVKPILKDKCYSCHSSKKQKGKLRLDSEVFILKGGKSGSVLGDVQDQGELLFRIHLPIEDEDHMPPSDNDQLTSGEIDLLTKWITDGAPFNTKISSYSDTTLYGAYAQSKSLIVETNWWPTNEVDVPEQHAVAALIEAGVSIEFLSKESNYLIVSFVSMDSITQNLWDNLLLLTDNIVSLKLNEANLTQDHFNKLSSFKNLRRLSMDNVRLRNLDLNFISDFKHLRYLNLSGLTLTNDQYSILKEITTLEHLVLYHSNTSEEIKTDLQLSLPNCKIEYGNITLKDLPSDTLIYRKNNQD